MVEIAISKKKEQSYKLIDLLFIFMNLMKRRTYNIKMQVLTQNPEKSRLVYNFITLFFLFDYLNLQ